MATRWYYSEFGLEFGPVSFSELVRLVREGELREDDLVRSTDEMDWRPAESVTGLFHLARREPGRTTGANLAIPETEGGRSLNRSELFQELCREASSGVPASREVDVLHWRNIVLRLVIPVVASLAVGAFVLVWSAGEDLRFPGLLEARGTKVFPVIGECRRLEYWIYFIDLLFAVGVGAYLAIRRVENFQE